jgi:Tfp pilus assembly protein PilE
MKRKILSLIISTTILSSGLIGINAAHANQDTVKKIDVVQLTKNSWLREYLPETTLLYARIPSLLTSISSKDDSFKNALGNQQYVTAINKIKEASKQWLTKSDKDIQPLLTLLMAQLNGPTELAALMNGPIPSALITTSLDISSSDELQLLIDSLIKAKVIRGEKTKLTDNAGELMTELGVTPYRWDPKQKRLNILLSAGGTNIAELDKAFSALVKNDSSKMLANEAKMDSSKQGLYVWLNNEVAYPLAQAMAPGHIKQQLKMLGVQDMKSLALSWGVTNQKGRIKLLLEAPHKGLVRELLPINSNTLDIATAGEPNFSALIALPSAVDFSSIESKILALSPNSEKYLQAKAGFAEKMGFKVEDIFASVGPELAVISDKSGEYSAIRIRDKAKFSQILDALKSKLAVEIINKEVGDKQITYMKIPAFIDEEMTDGLKDVPFFVTDILTKANSHVFWQQEGDYLIASDLPQVLIDRNLLLNKQDEKKSLSTWLDNTQKQDLSGSLLALSGSIDNAPRRLYYTYINVIQLLADITDAEVDIFSLPSARQLSMADSGTLGIQLDSTADSLGMEITFESTPADIILTTQGIASVATVGTLAAIAIPAYQDYLFKANIASANFDISMAKIKIEELFDAQSRLPNAQEAEGITLSQRFSSKYDLLVQPDTGAINVTITSKPGKTMLVEPMITEGKLEWQCRTDLNPQDRPKNCTADM